MNYKVFLLLLIAVLFSGCAAINSELTINKAAVKPSINTAIKNNNSLGDVLSRPVKPGTTRELGSLSDTDKRSINGARAKQAVMFERAKRVILAEYVDQEELLYLWKLSVDSYVEAKIIANKYTRYFWPEKLAAFSLYEDAISEKGLEIEEGLLNLDKKNVNTIFKQIMEQANIVNKMMLLLIAKE